jgi:diaminohydroxyphosphoribosylaminopyrimidine deaminase/5-amino-6-(5-phosphoribosylamino)uracil reductase
LTTFTDERFMALALTLGQRGSGNVWPNPAVGCVLIRNGRIVGRGWTQPGGTPHAEVVALQQAGKKAVGATAYVTLEPCAHTGKTGPCVDALVTAGIVRCVIATQDTDPRVAGKGADSLRLAGVEVSEGCLEMQAEAAHYGFFKRISCGSPRITLKLALSLDGRIATKTGESQWITGLEARRDVHVLRSCHDAVLVGGGTARADDPALTVRGLGQTSQPVRIVASKNLDFLGNALKASKKEAPIWLCHAEGRSINPHWNELADKFLAVPQGLDGRLNLQLLVQSLGAEGLTSVLCEGGGTFAAGLLKDNLIDDLIVYSAGVVIGSDGVAGLGALGVDKLVLATRFELVDCRKIGADIRHHWRSVNF